MKTEEEEELIFFFSLLGKEKFPRANATRLREHIRRWLLDQGGSAWDGWATSPSDVVRLVQAATNAREQDATKPRLLRRRDYFYRLIVADERTGRGGLDNFNPESAAAAAGVSSRKKQAIDLVRTMPPDQLHSLWRRAIDGAADHAEAKRFERDPAVNAELAIRILDLVEGAP